MRSFPIDLDHSNSVITNIQASLSCYYESENIFESLKADRRRECGLMKACSNLE